MKALNDPKQIVIINAGNRLALDAAKGSYDNYVESLKKVLDLTFKSDENNRFAPVKVVKSIEEAKPLNDVDALIFVTLGMRYQAEEIQKKFPHLKIIVMTGLLPKGEVIIMHKNWLTPETLLDFV